MANFNPTQSLQNVNGPKHEDQKYSDTMLSGKSQEREKPDNKPGHDKKGPNEPGKDEGLKGKAKELGEQASEMAHDVGNKIQEQSSNIQKMVSSYVSEHPITALGTAFLVGLGAALLLKK